MRPNIKLRNFKRTISFVLAVVILTSLFGGCTQKSNPSSSDVNSSTANAGVSTNLNGRIIKIGMLAYDEKSFTKSVVGQKKLKQIADIEKKYNCKIELSAITDYNALSASIVAGTPTLDIFDGGGPHLLPGYITGNLLIPLDDFGIFNFSDQKWDQSVTKALTIKGKHYGLQPIFQAFDKVQYNKVIYFNKSLLKREGIQLDLYKLQSEGNWTWAKLEEVANSVTDSTRGIWGIGDSAYELYTDLVVSNNDNFIKRVDDKLQFTPDSTNAMAALNFWKKLAWDDKSMRVLQPGADRTRDVNDFWQGKVAFVADYLERIKRGYPNMTDDFGVLFIPKGPNATDYTSAVNWFEYYSIPTGTKNPKEIATIMNEFFEPALAKAEEADTLDLQLEGYVRDQGSIDTIKQLASKSVLSEIYSGCPIFWGVDNKPGTDGWTTYLTKIANNEITPADAVKQVKTSFNQVIADTWKYTN